ncbi:hypothetical protein LOTGIDRAFT_165326 [Lottia gigantea]|uniref:Receptor for retinol uptake STRA6 n=1 Tax=Lottia gigantea TaxID=225164 RepID=V4BIV0_LOTGI|nr:hypothetical protein LOTGIDRAFT_165326 [Lottia gigantea]ESO88544.1 hypothetical protein LOTGIDRAFT_165326 [Lottia gigantea]
MRPVQYKYRSRCEETIDHYSFYQGFLIPAVLITLSFGFTKQRRQLFQDILNGRPGMVFPMDIMTRNASMSYAAAFGATLHLVALIIFQQKIAFEFHGPSELNKLLIIPSMIVYGLVYFPVFACLAIKSTYGYIMGSLYVWSFTALSFYKEFQCAYAYEVETVVPLLFRSIPQFVCLLYLCIGISRRCYEAFKTKKNVFETISEDYISETLGDIKDSYVGRHVRKLLIKQLPKPKPELPDDFKGKLIMKLKLFWNRWVYKRDESFKYSSRFKSVVFVVCYILAIVFAIFVNLISILHTMTSYRKNLRNLHNGIHTHIPATNKRSNTKLLVGSMRYAGYQVGYIAWGFVIQCILFFLLFMIIWALVDLKGMFIRLLRWLWPFILQVVFINVLQIVLAKFLFLQEKGAHLALENRRMLFTFTYFMFFYNIFVGLVSCFLRIFKTIVMGAVLLPRLDHSTLPQKFQFFDPGFAAYVGFMHIENSHNHPVVLVLVRILLASRRSKLKSAQGSLDRDVSFSNIETGTGSIGQSGQSGDGTRRQKAARFNWHVAYTLINNLELRLYRKGYLEALKTAKEGGIINQVTDNVYTDLSIPKQPQKPKINNSNFLKNQQQDGYNILEEDVRRDRITRSIPRQPKE